MIKKILGVVATAAMAFGAATAQATTYDYAGNLTYLGSFSAYPATVGYASASPMASGAFTNTWVFQFTNPLGLSANVNFLPKTPAGISPFSAAVYNLTGGVCAGAAGTLCSAGTVGSLVGSYYPDGTANFSFDSGTALPTGYYAIRFSGNVVSSGDASYSGQMIVTSAPEPATLGLLGLGLAAVGFVRRRRVVA